MRKFNNQDTLTITDQLILGPEATIKSMKNTGQTIPGLGVIVVPDAATYTVLAKNSGKMHIIPGLTADCTISLPVPQDGLAFEFVYGGVAADAQDWVIDTGSNTNYYLGGLLHADHDAGSAGDELVPIAGDGNSNSKLTVLTPHVGTRVSLFCDGTNWYLSGYVVSATVPTFADQS